jgi:transcriptional regulator with XRE-family HTH domain
MAVDKFEAAWKAAEIEALNDLPMALAQWRQGQNPDNAATLKRIEDLLKVPNSGLDDVTKATLEAHAETLRPQLNWSKPTIARMYQVVELSDPTEPIKAMLKEVQKDLLKGKAPGTSNRGRKTGATVGEALPGASKYIQPTCLLCGVEDPSSVRLKSSPKVQTDHDKASLALQYASSSQSSAGTLANKVRVHFRDVHNLEEHETAVLRAALTAIATDPEAGTMLTTTSEPKVRIMKFAAVGRPNASTDSAPVPSTSVPSTDQTNADAAAAMAAANA